MVSDSGKNIQTSFKTINGERRELLLTVIELRKAKELLERFEQLREILKNFNQNLLQLQTWETKTRIWTKVTQGPAREL